MRIEANTVKGLILALDRRKVQVPQVLEGKNFFVDIDGPRSGFSRREIAHDAFEHPKFLQAIKTNADASSWVFTTSAVLAPDYANSRWIPIFTYPEITDNFPWTTALVGGKYYFATKGIGLLEFDPVRGSIESVSGGGVPANIVSCTESGGRLVVLAEGIVAWSAIDDGRDFAPSVTTGAGFQSLSLIGSGSYESLLGVYKTPLGFVTFTHDGLMMSTRIDSVNPFRHDQVAFTQTPLNAHCITHRRDNEIIFLTYQGFFSTSGKTPQEWQPLMSEYFRLQILPALRDVSEGIVKLTYTTIREWLFVSISDSLQKSVYNRAFVWSAKSNEWGIFNRTHTAISELRLIAGPFTGNNLGYVDEAGNGFVFSFDSVDLLFPKFDLWDYRYAGKPQYNARMECINCGSTATYGVAKFPTVGYWLSIDESNLLIPGTVYTLKQEKEDTDSPSLDVLAAGVDEQSATNSGIQANFKTDAILGSGVRLYQLGIKSPDEKALDSYVEVGLFRAKREQDVDEFSLITDVSIGMLDSATIGIEYDDWLLDYSNDIYEDWSLVSPDVYEDWGLNSASQSIYTAKIEASLDGFTPLAGQDQTMDVKFRDGRTTEYTCYSTGLYHTIRLEANNPGESFHLKSLEISGRLAGRSI